METSCVLRARQIRPRFPAALPSFALAIEALLASLSAIYNYAFARERLALLACVPGVPTPPKLGSGSEVPKKGKGAIALPPALSTARALGVGLVHGRPRCPSSLPGLAQAGTVPPLPSTLHLPPQAPVACLFLSLSLCCRSHHGAHSARQ